MDQNLTPASIPTGLAPENSENFSSGGTPKTVYMMVKGIIYVNHPAQSAPSKRPFLIYHGLNLSPYLNDKTSCFEILFTESMRLMCKANGLMSIDCFFFLICTF